MSEFFNRLWSIEVSKLEFVIDYWHVLTTLMLVAAVIMLIKNR